MEPDKQKNKNKKKKETENDCRKDEGSEKKKKPDKLESGGGVLLLASPGLTLLQVEKHANGVCELLISEVPQLNMAAAVLYNPPKPNFSFPKFKEVNGQIGEIYGEE